jgi:hypothetical protein
MTPAASLRATSGDDAVGRAAALALAPLDRARRALFAAAGPRAAAWVANREQRVALVGAVVVLGALVTTAALPLWSLALGPVVLGVPHLLADVRYLWARPKLHRRAAAWLAIAAPIAVAAFTGRSVFGFAAIVGAAAIARNASLSKRVAIALVGAALVIAALLSRRVTDLAFAHLHNLVAVVLFWAWRPRAGKAHAVPLALFAAVSIAIALGCVSPLVGSGPGSWASHVGTLAPFAGPEVGLRLVLLYAFAQSVHYGVWLRLVPEEDRPREAPRPFASSFRALRADVGLPVIVATATLALGLALWAAFDLVAARNGYLRFAGFHGQLELAAAALLFLERRVACSAGS